MRSIASTLYALLSEIVTFDLIDEEATFDDFMTEFFADPIAAAHRARNRMAEILDRIEAHNRSSRYLLERFHFSHLALGSEWKWCQNLNERCAALGSRVVVLALPDNRLAQRLLHRAEHGGKDWQNLINRYGPEEKALRPLCGRRARVLAWATSQGAPLHDPSARQRLRALLRMKMKAGHAARESFVPRRNRARVRARETVRALHPARQLVEGNYGRKNLPKCACKIENANRGCTRTLIDSSISFVKLNQMRAASGPPSC
jgi:hypothetical protein